MKKPDWNNWIRNKEECKYWLDLYVKRNILIRSENQKKLFFKKAEHNFNLSNWLADKQGELRELFGETFYDWVINCAYYSIYHAALSLVSNLNYKSKSHSATLCFLIYYYYHDNNLLGEKDLKKIAEYINKEDIETIANSKSLRERASYNVNEVFEKGLSDRIRSDTTEFITKVRTILKL